MLPLFVLLPPAGVSGNRDTSGVTQAGEVHCALSPVLSASPRLHFPRAPACTLTLAEQLLPEEMALSRRPLILEPQATGHCSHFHLFLLHSPPLAGPSLPPPCSFPLAGAGPSPYHHGFYFPASSWAPQTGRGRGRGKGGCLIWDFYLQNSKKVI